MRLPTSTRRGSPSSPRIRPGFAPAHSVVPALARRVGGAALLALSACGTPAPVATPAAPPAAASLEEAQLRADAGPGAPARAGAWAQLDDWARSVDRTWVGPNLWANRLQDWRVAGQRLECIDDVGLPRRTVHTTAARLGERGAGFEVAVRIARLSVASRPDPSAAAGLLLGAGGAELDPRAAALIHDFPGRGGGWFCGVDGLGKPFLCSNEEAWPAPTGTGTGDWPAHGEVELVVRGELQQPEPGALDSATLGSGTWSLRLVTRDARTRTALGAATAEISVDEAPLVGNLALLSHPGDKLNDDFERYGFSDWRVRGERFEASETAPLGPILALQHTLSAGTLSLSAQCFPLGLDDSGRARLERLEGDRWVRVAEARIERASHTASFRVPDWPTGRDARVRVRTELSVPGGGELTFGLEGRVPRDPATPGGLVLAAFTGNHNNSHDLIGGFGSTDLSARRDWTLGLWFPHAELVQRVVLHEPDLLFFSGDQVYEGGSPTFADRRHPEFDYLYKWYLFQWAWRDLLNVCPSVVMPDDHDVYQGNLWGAGGRYAKSETDGGYTQPASFVRLVERTQTAHLPRPATLAPLGLGLRSWFTELRVGDVSFALLEDRKWKSGPARETMPETGTPRRDHVNRPDINPRAFDLPGLELLGSAQEAFLESWAADWRGARMKLVLSQSPFAGLATHHGPDRVYLTADLDSNGWPQAASRRALRLMRKAFAAHVNGDQHLAVLAQHGLDAHRDGPWSFTVPSIANFYPRAWNPPAPGANREPAAPAWSGDHLDGLGNRVSVFAATNPVPQNREPAALHDGMAGYGIVRIDTVERELTFECWPRWATPGVDPQYPGWPRQASQLEQYGAAPSGAVDLSVRADPPPALGAVAQLRETDGELIYALRLSASSQRLPLFGEGPWLLVVEDPETGRRSTLELGPSEGDAPLEVDATL